MPTLREELQQATAESAPGVMGPGAKAYLRECLLNYVRQYPRVKTYHLHSNAILSLMASDNKAVDWSKPPPEKYVASVASWLQNNGLIIDPHPNGGLTVSNW